jgi:hypothetical protein
MKGETRTRLNTLRLAFLRKTAFNRRYRQSRGGLISRYPQRRCLASSLARRPHQPGKIGVGVRTVREAARLGKRTSTSLLAEETSMSSSDSSGWLTVLQVAIGAAIGTLGTLATVWFGYLNNKADINANGAHCCPLRRSRRC